MLWVEGLGFLLSWPPTLQDGMGWDTRFDRVDVLLLLLSESLRCNPCIAASSSIDLKGLPSDKTARSGSFKQSGSASLTMLLLSQWHF